MATTNEQLSDWILKGCSNPQVIEERLGAISFVSGYQNLPTGKPGYSADLPTAKADVLGMAQIGKIGDTDRILQLQQEAGFPERNETEVIAELLDIPVHLCRVLKDYHWDSLTPAAELAERLRHGWFEPCGTYHLNAQIPEFTVYIRV